MYNRCFTKYIETRLVSSVPSLNRRANNRVNEKRISLFAFIFRPSVETYKTRSFRKYFPSDIEEDRNRGAAVRKSRKIRKREKHPASRILMHDTEAAEPIVLPPLQPEKPERQVDESPITCYKCYRKKQRRKRLKRQMRR